jgi:anti-sigma B factor antagonist
MGIKISTSDQGDVTVMKVSGGVWLDDGSREMYEAIVDQLNRGRKKIVLDMSEARSIDSSGLGYLVTAYTKVKNSGGDLVLANPAPKIYDLMHHATKLDSVVRMHGSVEEAVAKLGKSA